MHAGKTTSVRSLPVDFKTRQGEGFSYDKLISTDIIAKKCYCIYTHKIIGSMRMVQITLFGEKTCNTR